MQNAHADAKKMHRQFDEALENLAKLDGGKYSGEPDQPMNEFGTILNSTASNAIENDDQLRILRKGIDYLMVEAGGPHRSVEVAMEAAMQEAIDTAPDTLQGALLALLRHQLRGQRIDPRTREIQGAGRA